MALLALTARLICTDAIFKSVRVNRIATVSVENGEVEQRISKGDSPCWPALAITMPTWWVMEPLANGYDADYGWARTLYHAHYERSLLRLTWQGVLVAGRFFKPFLPLVSESLTLVQMGQEIWKAFNR